MQAIVAVRKSQKMLDLEASLESPLEKAIPALINRSNLSTAAKELGVSKATLSYWMLKLGITHKYIALAPGEEIRVVTESTI